ncbi:hypothetical protein KY289_027261 [Solanum tuberosum]|nr:hypothetical protein KY289_027261 [Solanum tuberosum]
MLRLGETSSGLDRTALLGGYFMSAIEHYSTLIAGQETPLEWTATFRHDSEDTRYETYVDLVHMTDVVEGTGHVTDIVGEIDLQISLLGGYIMPDIVIFGHDSEGTRYETDDVKKTGHEPDLVGGPDLRTIILEGYVMPAVEHYSTSVAGQGTHSLE